MDAKRAGMMMAVLMGVVAAAPQQAAVEKDVEAWRKGRLERLQSPTGWLTLVGLHWLKPGTQRAGSAKDVDITMDAGLPAHLGEFTLAGDRKVTFVPDPAVTATLEDGTALKGPTVLLSDATPKPSTVRVGSFSFFVIERGDKTGLRVKDSNSAARRTFSGIPHYPVDARWVVDAKFELLVKPQKLQVPNVLGQTEEMEVPGVAVFTVDGVEHRLTPVLEEPGATELFFIFADETSRTETYGAGRFLYAPLPRDGRITLDFNRAYNPPCAFTPFATCPLPPPQNRLKLKVTAGEKRYGKAH